MKLTVQKAKVSFDFQHLNVSELVTFADGTIIGFTGNTYLTTPPITIATVGTQITTLRNTIRQISAGNASKVLTAQKAQQANDLMLSLTTNGHYAEDTANTIAKGDLEKAKQIIDSSGYKLKDAGMTHPRSFEVVKSGISWIHLRVKAVGNRAGYAWKYGITTAKGTPPSVWSKTIFTLEAEVVVTNLKSAAIYGFSEASILPASHTQETSAASTATSRVATPIATTKAHKATFSDGQEPLQFGDIIYSVIQ